MKRGTKKAAPRAKPNKLDRAVAREKRASDALIASISTKTNSDGTYDLQLDPELFERAARAQENVAEVIFKDPRFKELFDGR